MASIAPHGAPTVATGVAGAAVRAARGEGIDERALLAEVGLSPEALVDPLARIAVATNRRLWEAAAAMTGRPDVGLVVGARVSPGSYGVVGLLAASCATVGEALDEVHRFYPLLSNGARFALTIEARTVTMSLVPLPEVGPFPRALADSVLSTYLAAIRRLSGEAVDPLEARLQLPRPREAGRYDDVIRAPVLFERHDNALVFDRSILAAPVRGAQRELRLILQAVAERTVAEAVEVAPGDRLVRRLEDWARGRLSAHEDTALRTAARHLGMSTRSLQRKLAERGLSYREVIAGVAMNCARELLDDPSLSVQQVAMRVGYEDLRAFARAFRRHLRQSPSGYRRRPRR